MTFGGFESLHPSWYMALWRRGHRRGAEESNMIELQEKKEKCRLCGEMTHEGHIAIGQSRRYPSMSEEEWEKAKNSKTFIPVHHECYKKLLEED